MSALFFNKMQLFLSFKLTFKEGTLCLSNSAERRVCYQGGHVATKEPFSCCKYINGIFEIYEKEGKLVWQCFLQAL